MSRAYDRFTPYRFISLAAQLFHPRTDCFEIIGRAMMGKDNHGATHKAAAEKTRRCARRPEPRRSCRRMDPRDLSGLRCAVGSPANITRQRVTEIERPDWWPTDEEVHAALPPEAGVTRE